MMKRRDFLKTVGAAAAATVVTRHPLTAQKANVVGEEFYFSSPAMEAQLSQMAPVFLGLNVDGLAKGNDRSWSQLLESDLLVSTSRNHSKSTFDLP